jgi:YidC/Oxa1 family membrane protein insertase
MNKNLILAISLSFLVMVIWARLTQPSKTYPIATQEVTESYPNQQPQSVPSSVMPQPDKEEALVSAISHNREIFFSLPSASLKKIVFGHFSDDELSLGQGLRLAEQGLQFTQERLNSQEAVFVYQDADKRITKRFDYSDPNFSLEVDIKIENLSTQSLPYPSGIVLGTIELNSRSLDARFKEVFIKQPDRILRLSPRRATQIKHSGEFFGFRERYFCAILIPISFPEMLQVVKPDRTKSQLVLSRPVIDLAPNQIGHLQYRIYLGPQQAELLKIFQPGTEEIIYFGFFDPIAKFLLNILRLFYRVIHNWGWAILAMSIAIFVALFPLSMKQMRSTREMQQLQPKIEELRRLYKDKPQRLNKEVLELYRLHKINPLGGCLPLILQIPIFFSLYQALMRSIELKGANFLWIKDLSQPDQLVVSPQINILPILMAITMFLQQKFTMMPAAGSTSEQQRMMTILFPVLFGFIFYHMPSGLVLYWFVNSLLMFLYQMRLHPVRKKAVS